MPTYEYACRKCGHQFEVMQSITAAPLQKCPSCGRATLKRLLGTGAALIFKGSGFYETDYKRGSGKSTGKAKPEPVTTPAKSETPASAPAAASAPSSPAPAAPAAKT